MATTKGKKGIKKSARMKKGKRLQAVKPLEEAISFNYGKLGVEYIKQK
jgi:hypothetical protein